MHFGELMQFLSAYGRHQVWRLRHEGVAWEAIEEELGITEARARSFFFEWSDSLDAQFRHQWAGQRVRVVASDDEFQAAADAATDIPTSVESSIPAVARLVPRAAG